MTAKAVLVAGAAKRIGRAIAFDLAAHGYAVAVLGDDEQVALADLLRKLVLGARAPAPAPTARAVGAD